MDLERDKVSELPRAISFSCELRFGKHKRTQCAPAADRQHSRRPTTHEDNSPQERAAESRSISTMMLAVDEDLELRSIRRGG
jgi:hypothetical protein